VTKVLLETSAKSHRSQGAHIIDGTYKAILAARAGASYRVARESREEFGESLAASITWTDARAWKSKRRQSGEA